jgi:hypothetical protein
MTKNAPVVKGSTLPRPQSQFSEKKGGGVLLFNIMLIIEQTPLLIINHLAPHLKYCSLFHQSKLNKPGSNYTNNAKAGSIFFFG